VKLYSTFFKKIANHLSNHDQVHLLVEFIVRMRVSSVVKPCIKKSYGSKTRISKIDDSQCYEAVIPRQYYTHPQYSKWIQAYEKYFLSDFTQFRFIENGSIVYKVGKENALKFISPLQSLQSVIVAKETKKRKREKCSCTSRGWILQTCGKCIHCCNDRKCTHWKKRQKKEEKQK
jgi:hypothetical protein